jgi:hypothetical protein
MTAFVQQTVSDIRKGRESWRVLFVFSILSFAISVATVFVRPF